jgi:hypothetical protein
VPRAGAPGRVKKARREATPPRGRRRMQARAAVRPSDSPGRAGGDRAGLTPSFWPPCSSPRRRRARAWLAESAWRGRPRARLPRQPRGGRRPLRSSRSPGSCLAGRGSGSCSVGPAPRAARPARPGAPPRLRPTRRAAARRAATAGVGRCCGRR